MADGALAAQQLVELLAVVTSCDDEETAIHAAIERAAETGEAEVCGLLVGDVVIDAVGLPEGSPDYATLASVPRGRGTIELPGIGPCGAGWAQLGRADEGVLVLARLGDTFTVAERNLIRGMAKVLGLTLRMLRTPEAERRRERLMRHLYDIQRLISRRAPLAEALRAALSAAADVLAAGSGDVELVLLDHDDPGHAMATRGVASGPMRWVRRAMTDDDLAAGVIGIDRVQERADDRGARSIAVPVHERGRAVGALAVDLADGRRLGDTDRDNLLSFAEHISLALTDARTARDMEAARHDPLTGLPGRALFHERLRHCLAQSRAPGTVALLFVDLDRFKAVNDTMGHAAGDALPAELSRRLQAVVRHDDLVGRLGGDEFVVVLCPAGEHHAGEVAARIIDELSHPVLLPGGMAEVGASIGIALNRSGDDEELIADADVAMYEAKRAGRGRCVLSGAADADARRILKGPSLVPRGRCVLSGAADADARRILKGPSLVPRGRYVLSGAADADARRILKSPSLVP
ncbi:diguanylate cyclase domain-containing protein [Dactylosporangium sp. CA-139066]|uniref:diguanylate cyclase domain-containing protein n=1 Tax=Dactylosporangium sp. CA-139066 TaxID=3239930 RepID=UPI003D8A4369